LKKEDRSRGRWPGGVGTPGGAVAYKAKRGVEEKKKKNRNDDK